MIVFEAKLASSFRPDLESLLFFNPQQRYVRAGIIEAIETFGLPSITEHEGWITIAVQPYRDVQNLFALDDRDGTARLAGVSLFTRTALDTVLLLHLAVAPDYGVGGKFGDELLVVRFISRLRDIARRLKGVRAIAVVYGKDNARHIPVG